MYSCADRLQAHRTHDTFHCGRPGNATGEALILSLARLMCARPVEQGPCSSCDASRALQDAEIRLHGARASVILHGMGGVAILPGQVGVRDHAAVVEHVALGPLMQHHDPVSCLGVHVATRWRTGRCGAGQHGVATPSPLQRYGCLPYEPALERLCLVPSLSEHSRAGLASGQTPDAAASVA